MRSLIGSCVFFLFVVVLCGLSLVKKIYFALGLCIVNNNNNSSPSAIFDYFSFVLA